MPPPLSRGVNSRGLNFRDVPAGDPPPLQRPRPPVLEKWLVVFTLAGLCAGIASTGWAEPGKGPPPDLPQRVLYYGVDQPLPQQIPLRAGPLSMVFEAGDLRYIKLGDREVLRRWYAATRDRNWGTLPNRISNLRQAIQSDSFRISYDVENREHDIDFVWHAEIDGRADGTITFTFAGEARSTFLRNRIGFCLLHPSRECPGARCRYRSADGAEKEGRFPIAIAPQNPFQDLQAFAHEVAPGVWAHLEFRGDRFEMEDQRNWVDASFKTFCTPLRLPYPVEVPQGTRIEQQVTLRLEGHVPPTTPAATEAPSLTFTQLDLPSQPLPKIGLGMASHGEPLTAKQAHRLRMIRPDHLRVDLRLDQPDSMARWNQAVREAEALQVPLEVALFVSDQPDQAEQQLQAFATQIGERTPSVVRWLVFSAKQPATTGPLLAIARRILPRLVPGAQLGGGTNAYFTELNRNRPPGESLDVIAYSLNPQVHAFDNRSLVETLEAHAATVESTRQFAGPAGIAVSPITFKPRFNPNATGADPPVPPGELPPQVDPRQMSLFGAGWTLGSIKYLAESGVASATYYETTGWRGVVETAAGSPAPARFRSLPDSVFPLFHVLADLREWSDANVLPSRSSAPLLVEGLILAKGERRRWLLANLTEQPQTVLVSLGIATASCRRLNETNVLAAMQDPEAFRTRPAESLQADNGQLTLQLLPYEVTRLDLP